jgi:alkylation response protein AidB-like acyl-CoA dehydrogenase
VHYAAWALSENDARAPARRSHGASYAGETYRGATYRNIQIFGAIGFTSEMNNHLFYKRARSNAVLLGLPAQQRKDVLRSLEADAA